MKTWVKKTPWPYHPTPEVDAVSAERPTRCERKHVPGIIVSTDAVEEEKKNILKHQPPGRIEMCISLANMTIKPLAAVLTLSYQIDPHRGGRFSSADADDS